MIGYNELIITPRDMRCNKKIGAKILVNTKSLIVISGFLVDKKNEKIEDAVIRVERINLNYSKSKIECLGYTITKADGSYCICVEKIPNTKYKLCVFAPLMECVE